MKRAETLRKAGVKVIANFVLIETAANLMRISEKADSREKLAASIMDVMEQLQLDGIFFTVDVAWLSGGKNLQHCSNHTK
jgi:precorrin-6B methylase 2